MDGVIGTVVLGIVVGSIVAAGLYGRRKKGPESEPAMRGATVAAVAPTAAGAFRAVSAPAEPSTMVRDGETPEDVETPEGAANVEQPSTPAKERRRLSNNGARRFAQPGNNVRTVRSIQTR